MWTRDVQDVIFAILMCGWLGGLGMKDEPAKAGKLLTIEEVGEILNSESESSSLYTKEHEKMDNSTSFHLKRHQFTQQDQDCYTSCSQTTD